MTTDPREEIVAHIGSLRAFARTLTRDATLADDMVQDTIEKAWSNIDKFQTGTNMRAWLYTILRNTYYSHLRKRNREVGDSDGSWAESLTVKPDHDGHLALQDFAAAFVQLPLDQREALMLIGASGFTCEEAAEMCGCATGTIKSRANRGRARLAELLGLQADETMEMTDGATLAALNSPDVT
jgi:RNA polymerase sigma-70 factor (ECF subfamily)